MDLLILLFNLVAHRNMHLNYGHLEQKIMVN